MKLFIIRLAKVAYFLLPESWHLKTWFFRHVVGFVFNAGKFTHRKK